MTLFTFECSSFSISELQNRHWIIRFSDRMDVDTTDETLCGVRTMISRKKPLSVTADLSGVTYIDDFGALIIYEIRNLMKLQKGSFEIIHAKANITEILDLVDFEKLDQYPKPKSHRALNIVMRIGQAAIREASGAGFMLSFLGSVIFSVIKVLKKPRSLRMDDTITQMEKTGVDALPIVALISFLLGLIMAFMSSIQFRQFGAGIYVASLVAFAMVSELGPIMTAIIVAGRSGSAFAAEIGTMKISEEIDALVTMGFDPTLFLAVPRIFASMIVVPILTLFSDLFAISGGLIVGFFMLDLTPNTYLKQSIEALSLFEVTWSMIKSTVFAALISWVGCLRGFQASGGAASVGNAATSAVVTSIFLIILFDSLFAVIRSYW